MRSFKDRTAVVTGAGSGIGRSLAIQLEQQGCAVALVDIDAAALAQTREVIARQSPSGAGSAISLHEVDVANQHQVEALALEVAREHGNVNLLINNAGVALGATVAEAQYEDMHWLMNINFWGVVHGCKAFLPSLLQSGEGHIVNISSVFGLMAVPTQSAYNASKFAVRGFSEALRLELQDQPVAVSTVFPAGVKTNIVSNARMQNDDGPSSAGRQVKLDKLFVNTAEDAAREILAGVKKCRPRILVGKGAGKIDFFTRLMPIYTSRFISGLGK